MVMYSGMVCHMNVKLCLYKYYFKEINTYEIHMNM